MVGRRRYEAVATGENLAWSPPTPCRDELPSSRVAVVSQKREANLDAVEAGLDLLAGPELGDDDVRGEGSRRLRELGRLVAQRAPDLQREDDKT